VIGMWGSPAAGKTVYLIALHHDILQRKENDERWGMRGASDAAHALLVNGFTEFMQNRFPPPTDTTHAVEPLTFEILRPYDDPPAKGSSKFGRLRSFFSRSLAQLSEGGAEGRKMTLDLFDPAGQLFSEPNRLMSDVDPMAASCREMLSNSRGLLCMVDPDQPVAEYFPLIYQNFVNLSQLINGAGGGPLPIPVAICIMKSDQYLDAFDDPRRFLRQHIGMAAYAALTDFCSEKQFFAVSSMGRNNVVRDATTGVYTPLGLPKPENVLAPIDWLLDVMR
jgi:hypothetical protein